MPTRHDLPENDPTTDHWGVTPGTSIAPDPVQYVRHCDFCTARVWQATREDGEAAMFETREQALAWIAEGQS